ncbi:hypothetical protein DPMN_016748 [Dreissena polymorpha]|uniref:MADF domain-containing protein n=1 Tax=Dreissena polymorpha TaxID=45954 RepID=A0A9D4NA87_DREPO|nr:hypothetical protein DPMN_016748 [Dreissena polymorpha]
MVEWLKEHPMLYNNKLSSYKDKAKKDALWNEQAVLLEKDVSILHVWCRSLRTRFISSSSTISGGTFKQFWNEAGSSCLNSGIRRLKCPN